MNKDGFSSDDIASTFARFASKRRNIICDESMLERKKSELVHLPCTTRDYGGAIFAGIESIMNELSKSNTRDSLDEVYESLELSGWKSGSQGYGYYREELKD